MQQALRQPAHGRYGPRQRAAGAARPGSADRLQASPVLSDKIQKGPVGRARAVGRRAPDLRAGARDPGLRAGRVLVADRHADARKPAKNGFPFPPNCTAGAGSALEPKSEDEINGDPARPRRRALSMSPTSRSASRSATPPPPFITSTLQQEASRKLGFGNRRTMSVAQDLYEGVELGAQGSVGLITYMRTDSVRVAAEAQAEARQFIARKVRRRRYVPAHAPNSSRPKARRRTRTKRSAPPPSIASRKRSRSTSRPSNCGSIG